jgi:glycosyltransferase involved in cell wall biosynthesis
MKIMVAAPSFSSEISGILRHALNMVRCLLRRPEITRVDLVVAPWQTKLVQSADYYADSRLALHVAPMDPSSLSRNLWYYRGLPKLAAQLQPDVVHLSYPAPLKRTAFGCATVVTLHDLYPFEIPGNFGFPQVLFNRLILRQCLNNVDAIACVSDTTLRRLRRYVPLPRLRKAIRIYNCVEPEPVCATQSPLPGWRDEPFLLSVAQHRKNKNIALLIRTFYRLLRSSDIHPAMKLAVVGIEGPETQRIQQLLLQLNIDRNVLLLRGLSDPELQWCYARCEALVAPSKTEGFGLPVAEGLLAGCRIVCSDISAFREVGGRHCRFVVLGRDEEHRLAAAIREALQEPPRQPVSLPHLSTDVLAKQYLHLYRNLTSTNMSLQSTQCLAPAHAPVAKQPLYLGAHPSRSEGRSNQRGYI